MKRETRHFIYSTELDVNEDYLENYLEACINAQEEIN